MAHELGRPGDGDGRKDRHGRQDRDGHEARPRHGGSGAAALAQQSPAELRVAFAPGTGRDDAPVVISVEAGGTSAFDPTGRRASLAVGEAPRARLTTADGSHALLLATLPDARRAAEGIRRVEVVIDGWRFEVDVESEAHAGLRERATNARDAGGHRGPAEVRAIIPGRVVSVDVAEGDAVEAGGRLLVLEAMKMQNEVRAPRGGTVARVGVGPGQTVELGDVLLVIE